MSSNWIWNAWGPAIVANSTIHFKGKDIELVAILQIDYLSYFTTINIFTHHGSFFKARIIFIIHN